jgi:arginyl-tRNA synthetase
LVQATSHLTHGMVKLSGGAKMSSRQGNIIKAIDVLEAAAKANKELSGQDDDRVVNGAVKYAFLKSRMGGDINYDPNESVSLEGNSGPYLQYAHARACSILQKSDPIGELNLPDDVNLEAGERSLVKKLGEYSEAVDNAAKDLMPHHVCTYLYELAQDFNRFYENNRVIDDPRQSIRLKLVSLYADTLKAGLSILGIASPDKM